MVKVLEINVDDIGAGGVFSFVKNVICRKDADVQIHIASIEPFENKENIKNLEKLGTNVFYVGYSKSKILKQFVCVYKLLSLLRTKHFDCVHIHSDVSNKLFVSGLACRMANIKKIILHSHASGVEGNNRFLKSFFHSFFRPFLKFIGTDFLSCSDLASVWMYPNVSKDRIKIINNGVDLRNFQYDIVKRRDIRKKLEIENKYVIGHIGRFVNVKNHSFIIDIFMSVKKRCESAILLLVGDGILQDEIKSKVEKYGLSDSVIFYGLSSNVSELFQAMDVFILPSKSEGFPIVGVEAQASGLPVLFSDKITRSAKLLYNTQYLSIEKNNIEKWSDEILNLQNHKRTDTYNALMTQGFDITQTVKSLMSIYKS